MKKLICLLLVLTVVLAGCKKPAAEVEPTEEILPEISTLETTEATIPEPEITEITQPTETQPEETESQETEPAAMESQETEPVPTEPEVTEPVHSDLYLEGVSVEDVIVWFNEVVLDGEFINSGDPSRLQKWETPIAYFIYGEPTAQDLQTLATFTAWLNTVEGFPGISETETEDTANLRLHFTDEQGLLDVMGANFSGLDGAVTFWYDGMDRIYDEVICIRTDLDQTLRNSVILEEVYNGLGPVQDTNLRTDSIIYQDFTQPQELTVVDQLLLKLLYHPDMECGMNAIQCEEVIRKLYY